MEHKPAKAPITGGERVCMYENSGYRAILVGKPQSLNPAMRFLHALIVFPIKEYAPPILYVTAERLDLNDAALGMMEPDAREVADMYANDDGVFLRLYESDATLNYGSDPSYSSKKAFEKAALKIVREHLQLQSDFAPVTDVRKGDSFEKAGCMGAIAALALVLTAMLGRFLG